MIGCLGGVTILLSIGLIFSFLLNFVLLAASVGEPVAGGKYRERKLWGEGTDKIAVISIQGIIMKRTGPDLFGISRDMLETIQGQLKQAVEDSDVRAVVVEIDSPGGSVTASDIIYQAVAKASQKKKVVVLMGDLCASGGYYIAVGADKIYAHPTSLTGSIGAIIAGLDLSGLMERFGVKENVVKSGPIKDILSSTRAMTEEERQILQDVVDGAYDRFVSLVTQGRSISREKLGNSADGRIFLAPRAKDVVIDANPWRVSTHKFPRIQQ